jgi:hypothetical protein
LAVGPVDFGNPLAEGITRHAISLGGLDALDTTPTFACLGDQLPHFLNGMMLPTVVAIRSFCSHVEGE